MNAKDLERARLLELTLDEEWNLSAQIMAAAAKGVRCGGPACSLSVFAQPTDMIQN